MNRRARQWLPFFLITAALGSILPCASYFRDHRKLIQGETRRLVDIGSLATKLVKEDSIQKAKESYNSQDGKFSESESFAEMGKILRSVQTSQKLEADIAIFIRPAWKTEQMVFIAMGAEKSYVGNGLPLPVEALKAWEMRKATARLWTDEDGSKSLTAYVPLLSESGEVLAMAQVVRSVTANLNALRTQWLVEWLLSQGAFALLTYLLFALGQRRQSRLFRKIREAIFAAFPKEGPPLLPQTANEESLASELLTHTHSLREEKESIRKEAKALSEERLHLKKQLDRAMRELLLFKNGSPVPLLVFDARGLCLFASQSTEKMFEGSPEQGDIGKLLNAHGKPFETAFESALADPTRLPLLLEQFPQSFTARDGSAYRLRYQVFSPVEDKRYLVVAAEQGGPESDLRVRLEDLEHQLELLGAYRRYPSPMIHYLASLVEWSERPLVERISELFLLSGAFGLTRLKKNLGDLMKSQTEPMRNAVLHTIKRAWRLLEEGLAGESAQESETLSLSDEISFWPYYFQQSCELFGKKARLEIKGQDLPGNFRTSQKLLDTLRAGLRNAIEHGIEAPEARSSAGKAPEGKVTVSFESFRAADDATWCLVRIEDDGRGITPKLLREDLRAFSIDTSRDTDHHVMQHLFEQGISFKPENRGNWDRENGLHGLAKTVQERFGVCELDSIENKGTTLTVMFPVETPTVLSDTTFLQAA